MNAMRDGRLPINLIDHVMVSEAAEPICGHGRRAYPVEQTGWSWGLWQVHADGKRCYKPNLT